MKRTIIYMMIMLSCVASVSAWGFDIWFTDQRFVVWEDDKIIGLVEQENIILDLQQEFGSIEVSGSNYMEKYSDLVDEYEGKIFYIQTDKRTLNGYLEDGKLHWSSDSPDYIIEVKDEEKLLDDYDKYLKGEGISLIDLEKNIQLPWGLRVDLVNAWVN